MKLNKITVAFMQLIPARIAKHKQADGSVIEKNIPAEVVETRFSNETEKGITATDVAMYFMTRLVSWQKLRQYQSGQAFRTSKNMTVEITVNNKQLTGQTKFTTNPDRLLANLDKQCNFVGDLAKALNAPAIGASKAVVEQYLILPAANVLLAKPKVERKPKAKKALVINMEKVEQVELVEN